MNFIEKLHKKIPAPCFDRPFVCDGLPQECSVIVIGQNPATPTAIDWWDFWTDDRGFDLKKFEGHYEKSRLTAGKSAVSPTRRRLNYLRVQGLECLETNVFIDEHPRGHGSLFHGNDLLDLFVENLPKLKVVIAYGNIASKCLEGLVLRDGVERYPMPHLFNMSYANLDSRIGELKLLA